MKYFELNKKEEQILKDFERGSFKSAATPRLKQQYQQYAQATLSKTRNINIRIPEKDLLNIKARAAEQGIPYQTLLASLIHQYSSGKIQD